MSLLRDVVLTFDHQFLPGALACIRSLQSNLPENSTIWVIFDGRSKDALGAMRDAAGPHDLQVIPAPVIDLPLYGATSASVYSRLYIADLLPHLKKVLYLDADLIALHPLIDLMTTDVEGVTLAAVQDHMWRHGPNGDLDAYFNSGVLVINLDLWRAIDVGEKARRYVQLHDCRFWDQDALNYVLSGRWRELDPLWNVFHFTEVGDYAWGALSPRQCARWWQYLEDEAHIIQYVTGRKPWLPGYPPGRNYERFARFTHL